MAAGTALGDRSRGRWWVAYLLALVVAVGGAGWYGWHRHQARAASGSARHALVDKAFSISLSVHGARHGHVPLGAPLIAAVEVRAAVGLHDVELWDGSHQVDARPLNSRTAQVSFRWSALSAGQHVLFARALDGRGEVSSSKVVAFDVTFGRRRTPVAATVAVRPGETASDVSGRLGVPAAGITVSGARARVVVPVPKQTAGDGDKVVVDAPSSPGSGPVLAVRPRTCGVDTSVTGARGTVQLIDAAATQPGFEVVGQTATMLPGVHVLAAKTATAESLPVSVTIPQSCVSAIGWKGTANLVSGVLTMPKPATHAYAYLQIGDKPAVRLPSDPKAFLLGSGKRLDVADYIPDATGSTLHLEVWDQQGKLAVPDGSGDFAEHEHDFGVGTVLGEPESAHIAFTQAHLSDTFSPTGNLVDISWSTSDDRVASVGWQVTFVPLAADNTQLFPLGQLAAGASAENGIDLDGVPGHSGHFTVDLAAVKGLQPGSALPGDSQESVLQHVLATAGGVVFVRAVGRLPGQDPSLPNAVGDASNTLSIYVPPTDKVATSFTLGAPLVLIGSRPNPNNFDCVVISNTHWNALLKGPLDKKYGVGGWEYLQSIYPKDEVVCPGVHHNDGYCDGSFWCSLEDDVETLADAIADIWDFIADTYNDLITAVVDGIASLNPLCHVLDGKSAKSCKEITQLVVRAGVNAVLTAYGIPPQLPTSQAVRAAVNGDLSAVGEQLLDELGIPCDNLKLDSSDSATATSDATFLGVEVPHSSDGSVDACKIAIEAAIKEVKDAVGQSAQDSTAAEDGLTPCLIELCTMTPDPTGRAQPVMVLVKAFRTGGAAVAGQPIDVGVDFQGNLTGYTDGVDRAVFQGGRGVFYSQAGDQPSAGVLLYGELTDGVGLIYLPADYQVTTTVRPPRHGEPGYGQVTGQDYKVTLAFGPMAPDRPRP